MNMRKEGGCRDLARPGGRARSSWEGEAPAVRSVGGRWQWPAASGHSSRLGSAFFLTAAARGLELSFWFRRTCSSRGGREGEKYGPC